MKKTIRNIIIHILLLIFGFILASSCIDSIILQDACISPNFAINNSVKSVSGDTNTYNPFKYLNNMPVYWGSNNWQWLYNYYDNDTLNYLYNGIYTDTGFRFETNEVENLVLDLAFIEPIQVDPLNKLIITLDKRSLYSTNNFSVVYTMDWDIMNSPTYTTTINLTGNDVILTFTGTFVFRGLRIQNIEYLNPNGTYPLFKSATYGSIGGDSAYNSGYDVGYQDGVKVSYDNGYNDGYDEALSQGISNPEHIFYTIWSILTTCGDILYQFFTTPIWGDVTLGFVFIIIPFGFNLIEKVIHIIIKLVGMLTGG